MKLIRMNERIIELNAQADKYAWEKVGEKYDEFGSLNRSLNWQWEDTKMEKFAELIVEACNQYALRNWEHGHLLGQDLKIYFGMVDTE